MEITALVQSVTPWLVAAAPYLVKLRDVAGEEAVKALSKEAATKIGGKVWESALAVWGKLSGSGTGSKPDVLKAVQDVASAPNDDDTHAALRVQLKKALAEDSALREELLQIFNAAKAGGVNVTASGDRSVATGGDVIGSTIITGDRNKLVK